MLRRAAPLRLCRGDRRVRPAQQRSTGAVLVLTFTVIVALLPSYTAANPTAPGAELKPELLLHLSFGCAGGGGRGAAGNLPREARTPDFDTAPARRDSWHVGAGRSGAEELPAWPFG